MSNETDLDWLARNVHKWPAGDHQPWCYVYWKGGQRAVSGNRITIIQPCVRVEMSEWLARRAELQNKPSWAEVPAEAEYMTQNSNGAWGCWNDEPAPVKEKDGSGDTVEYWGGNKPLFSFNKANKRIGEILGDWRDTLEKRPEQDEFETFTSIEDNQEQDMPKQQEVKQDNGWFERGELPPVGVAVQLWHGGTYAYDCELISKRGNDFVLWNLTWDRPDSADCMMCEFKPIPTERDVLIEIIKKTDDTDDKIADAILAAGFRRGSAA